MNIQSPLRPAVRRSWLLAALAGAALHGAAAAQDGNFRYAQVPNPGGTLGLAGNPGPDVTAFLNDNGVIVGAIKPTGNNAAGAFYSINGAAPVTINPIAANGQMTAQVVNNNGLIVGSEFDLTNGTVNAWYYKVGVTANAVSMSNSGIPATIIGYQFGINNADKVVARVGSTGNVVRGFVWNPQGANNLPSAAPVPVTAIAGSGTNTSVDAINNSNIAVGFGQNGANSQPARYDLTTPGNSAFLQANVSGLSHATSINDSGVIVGSERLVAGSGNPVFPYFFSTGSPRSPIPGFSGAAQGSASYTAGSSPIIANIANSNLVTFSLTPASGANRAALFTSLTSTTSFDLNSLVASGFTTPAGPLEYAAINKHGQVAAQVLTVGGNADNRVYLGTPELNWRSGFSGAGASGNWTDANVWSWGVTPGAMHPVIINGSSAGAFTVTLASARQAAELNVGTSGPGTPTLQLTGVTLRATNNDGTMFGNYSSWSSGKATIGANGSLSLTGATLSADQGIVLNSAVTTNVSSTMSSMVSLAGTLDLGAATRTFTVASFSATSTDLAVLPVVTNGGITKAGAGLMALGGNNTFTGGVTINAGVLRLDNVGALNSSGVNAVSFGASSTGTLRLNGNSVTVSGLSTNAAVGTPVVENGTAGTATLTVNNASSQTFAGVLQNGTAGTLAFAKAGNGTLTLSGANTISGGVTISGGLVLANTAGPNSATGSGPVSVGASAILGGTGRVGGSVTVSGTVQPGDGATAATSLAVGGGLTLSPGSFFNTVADTAGATGTASSLAITGALDLSATGALRTIRVFNEGGANGFPFNGQSYQVTIANMASTVNPAGGFNPSAFTVLAGNFLGFASAPVISNPGGTSLRLTFTPVPEPATVLFACALMAASYGAVGRRLGRSRPRPALIAAW